MNPFIWLGLIIVLLAIEIATLGLTTIWFAGGALGAFIANLAGIGELGQIIIFLLVSFLLLLTVRPFAAKKINANTTKTNVDSLIGQQAKVTEVINNIAGTGQVFINGMEWTARAKDEEKEIHIDTIVTIIRVEGVKLIVE